MAIKEDNFVIEAFSFNDSIKLQGELSIPNTVPTIKFVIRDGKKVAVNRITMSQKEREENSIFYDISEMPQEYKDKLYDLGVVNRVEVDGREIFYKESPKDLGECVRLMNSKEIIIDFMTPEEKNALTNCPHVILNAVEGKGYEIEQVFSLSKYRYIPYFYNVSSMNPEFLEKYAQKGIFEIHKDENGYYHSEVPTFNDGSSKKM